MLRITPNAIVAQAVPQGLPLLRNEFLQRTGLFKSSLDPNGTPGDPGLFGPGSATWALASQPSQALAGLRAALLQALSIPIPTATHSTGKFYDDFLGRVSRTGAFVEAQNLGSMDEVHRAARRVRAMHRTVNGVGKDGTPFDATDPHQSAWVSITLTDSILVMSERFGRGPIPRRLADAFVLEQSTHAALLDHRVDLEALMTDPDRRAALQAGTLPLPLIQEGELPTTHAQLRSLMDDWAGELGVSRLTRALLDATVRLEGLGDRVRQVGRPFMLATLSTIPDPCHEILAPDSNRTLELLAAEGVQYPIAFLQALLGELPGAQLARDRVKAGAIRNGSTAVAA